MAYTVHDTFTGSAGTDLAAHTGETGAIWTKHSVSSTRTAVLSDANRVRASATGTGERRYYAIGIPASADYAVEGVFAVKGAGLSSCHLGARLSTSADTGIFAGYNADSDVWQLFQNEAGVFTSLGSSWAESLTDATRTARLVLEGTTATLYVEGVARITGTTTITAAGRVGVRFGTNMDDTTGVHLDSIWAAVPISATLAGTLPGPTLSAAASTTRSGALAGTLPSPTLSAMGVLSSGLEPAISDPFGVTLAPGVSAPFSVQAAVVGPGPLVGPSLSATGALLIQGEMVGTLPGPVLVAEGIGQGAVLGGHLPSPTLVATGVLAQSDRVLIGGIEYRIYEDPPLEIEDFIEERSTARFVVRDDDGSLSFSARQPVSIYDHEGARIFGGYLDTIQEVRITQEGAKRHEISCIDNHYKADKRRVAASYENETVDAIVSDLVLDYLTDEGVSIYEALIDPGPVIGEAVFNYGKVSECLQTIAERVNYWWRIDHDGVLHFRERGTEAAPWTLTGTDIIGTPNYSKSSPMYRNRQYIRGLRDLTDPQTFTRAGDGETREWTMGFPIAKVPTVEVNGTPATTDLKMFAGDHSADFYWQKGDPVVVQDSGAAVLTGSDEIEVTYQGEFNLIVVSEDTAGIIEQQTLEGGGSGIVESVDDDASLGTRTAALEKAAALLKKYAIAGEQLSFTTLRSGLEPGMVQTVNLPAHDLDNDELLIAGIHTERIRVANPETPSAPAFVYRRTVTEILGPSIGSWAKFFLRLTQAPSFIDRLSVGEEGALAIQHGFDEEIGIAEDVTFSANACSFPSESEYPSESLYPC